MERMLRMALAFALVLSAGCGADDGKGSAGEPTPKVETTSTPDARPAPAVRPDVAQGPDVAREPDRDAPPEGGPTDQAARGDYRDRADRICQRAQLDIARQSAEFRKLLTRLARGNIEEQDYFQRGGELTNRSGEIAQRAVGELRELSPPVSGQASVETYLDGAEKQSAILLRQGAALAAGDPKEVASLNKELLAAGAKTRAAARRFGFRRCGVG